MKNLLNRSQEIASNLFESKIIDNRSNSKQISLSKILNDEFNIIDALDQLGLTSSRSECEKNY